MQTSLRLIGSIYTTNFRKLIHSPYLPMVVALVITLITKRKQLEELRDRWVEKETKRLVEQH